MKELKRLLSTSVEQIISNSISENKLSHIAKKHDIKVHFVPKRYRILGGILQSMNIQFGNFIEVVMENILKENPNIKILSEYSNKKSNAFLLTEKSENMIDSYITACQTSKYTQVELLQKFNDLIVQIHINERDITLPLNTFTHDVDALFLNEKDGNIYYVEIKYNDDHDTGKFTDISRKFLKTFAYLIREFDVKGIEAEIKPILFYFNNKKMKNNDFLPEEEVIFRGKRFFDTFTTIDYEILSDYMIEISESEETVKLFDDLYKTIMK